MSEEIKNEKTAEEQLAEVVKTTVTKAVEGIEVPSVEGLAKSEEVSEEITKAVEAAKAESSEELKSIKEELDEVKATVANAPSIIKGKDMEKNYNFEWDNETFKAQTTVDFTKAENNTTNIDGAPTASQRLFFAMQQHNPFRGVSTVMPTSATAVNLPSVTGIAAAHEANIPSAINTSSGHPGDIATKQVIPQNWTSRTLFSDQSVADLPSLDPMVAGFMGQQIAIAEATDQVAQLKAAVNLASGGISRVDTAVATTRIPTTINPWADVVAELSSAYKPNARWMMSREALRVLRSTDQAEDGSDLIINPSDGNFMFWGYPIIINDHLEDFSANNNLVALFGDFSQGSIIVSRKEMNISRHEDTIPGGVYYYGNMRSRGTDWDRSALVALRATIA